MNISDIISDKCFQSNFVSNLMLLYLRKRISYSEYGFISAHYMTLSRVELSNEKAKLYHRKYNGIRFNMIKIINEIV